MRSRRAWLREADHPRRRLRRRGAARSDRRHPAERVQRVRFGGIRASVGREDRLLAGSTAEIRATNPDGSWPFGDAEFDIVVSNQVGEHVVDLETFCAENARVLRPGGFGVHAFPLKHILLEPHMRMPLVHRVRDHELRSWLIGHFSRFGSYRTYAREGVGAHEFALSLADYCRTFTTYRTWRQVCDEFHRHGFRVSYRHSSTLAQRGLWRLVGKERAGTVPPPAVEALLFPFVRSFVSCTLVVQKAQDFRPEDYWPAE